MKRDARLKSMTSSEIRGSFLEFFRKNGHAVLPSSSLVPGNDPTLLFTNAGMVQFKDLFLGKESRDYSRAATAQRCVRAGGKHNDLENVGYTARHHTFFEMLGNFSFGDYFKREAIHFAWNFITGTLGIPKDRLWVTVFLEDDEAARIWTEEIGIDPTRCTRMGEKSNFWSMGETGPCGPCTEIFYDHGAEIPGGPPGSPDEDGDRYVEIWNLVFMQYDRSSDGVLVPLPKPSVDTGMGLERVAAVMQGVHSNYDIDLFKSLIRSAAEITGTDDLESSSLRVIADHIRACTFLIVDGVVPSNEGRGYVLRRIIRRAIRHGYKLGQTQPFFHKLVASLVREMGAYYAELVSGEARATQVLAQEEIRFAETLSTGMALLDAEAAKLTSTVIPGETVFRLYDTYGFPLDLTADVARERGLTIDQAGFDAAMDAQRHRARAASKFGAGTRDSIKLPGKTDFSGYDRLTDRAVVTALIFDGAEVTALRPGSGGPGGAGPHAVLRRKRRPNRRCRPAARVGGALHRARHAEDRGVVRPCRGARVRRVAGGRWCRRTSRRRAPNRHCAQSFGNALAARGAEKGRGYSCRTKGFAGGRRSIAFRLFAHAGADFRGTAPGRGSRELGHSTAIPPPRRG